MSKVVRVFKTKAKALAFIEQAKKLFPGMGISGATCMKSSDEYYAYVFGNITKDMADKLKPRSNHAGFFEYK